MAALGRRSKSAHLFHYNGVQLVTTSEAAIHYNAVQLVTTSEAAVPSGVP